MRHLVAAVLLVAAFATGVRADQYQLPSSGSAVTSAEARDCNGRVFLLDGDGAGAVPSPATMNANTTVGRAYCMSFSMLCTARDYTRMAFGITTAGPANSQQEVGIYTFDPTALGGNGGPGVRVVSSGPQSSSSTGSPTVSGLGPFTLQQGTAYVACWAGSDTTGAVRTVSPGSTAQLANLVGFTPVNVGWEGGNGAAQIFEFNGACTGAGAPYTCCSGADTGTCTGMAGRTGVPGAASGGVSGPLIVISP